MMPGLDEFKKQVTEDVGSIEVSVIGTFHLCQIIVKTHKLLDLPMHSVERLLVRPNSSP